MVDDEAQMTTKDQELTESEIAALLNAVSDNTSDIYSLEALEKQNDTYNEFKTLEIINSHFARGLERTLSYVAQRIVHVEVETWGLMRRDDCLKQTSQMATCAVLDVTPMLSASGQIVFSLHNDLHFLQMSAVSGVIAPDKPRITSHARTNLEQTLAQSIVTLCCSELANAWHPVFPFEFQINRFEENPKFALSDKPANIMLSATFCVSEGEQNGHLILLIPFDVIAPIKNRLYEWPEPENIELNSICKGRLTSHLNKTHLRISALLGSTQMTLRNVIRLQVGDIVCFDQPTDRPLSISINHVHKFMGTVNIRKGRFAMTISKKKTVKNHAGAKVVKLPVNPTRKHTMGGILDVPIRLTAELGGTRLLVSDFLELKIGSVIELDKEFGEPMELFANGKLVGVGEVVVVNKKFGLRLTEIVPSSEEVA